MEAPKQARMWKPEDISPYDFKDDLPVNISVCLLPFGMDYSKIIMEDETYLLYLLNMDLKRYQNPLSTAFIYGIIG